MSDDTPTARFEVPPDGEGDVGGRMSKTLIIVLSVASGLLLIAVVVLVTLLFSQGLGGSPAEPVAGVDAGASAGTDVSPSPSPSDDGNSSPSTEQSTTPSAAPPPPPPPPPTQAKGPRFTSFAAPASQGCSAGGPGFEPTRPTFTVSWSTAGADQAWFVNGTDDAANSRYLQIPLNGDQSDFPYEQSVDCSDGSNTYTITLVGPDGNHVSKSWTVRVTGDHF